MSYASDMSNNRNTLLFAVSALIIALSVGYYFVIFLPKNELVKFEQQRQEQKIEISPMPTPTPKDPNLQTDTEQLRGNDETAKVMAYSEGKKDIDRYFNAISGINAQIAKAEDFIDACSTNSLYASKYGSSQACIDHWNAEVQEVEKMKGSYETLIAKTTADLIELKKTCRLCY